jgi:hypothetical protein
VRRLNSFNSGKDLLPGLGARRGFVSPLTMADALFIGFV